MLIDIFWLGKRFGDAGLIDMPTSVFMAHDGTAADPSNVVPRMTGPVMPHPPTVWQ